ncbi:MAG: DUF692 domain-containing protein [Pseudomonadales bacterium]
MSANTLQGAGLGLRRGLLDELLALEPGQVDFLELAPENWIGVGGVFGRQFQRLAERFPLVCHGLSLSIGSPAPLDHGFLKDVRGFLDQYNVLAFTEHLSYCSDDKGHLYDLMPIPFTEEAVHYVAGRIREVQDVLGRQIAVEHISYYAAPGQQLSEIEFINAVLAEADCRFLLDVNNIYVNSVNFDYDADAFLRDIDGAKSLYVHIAGHYEEAPDLRIDTHGTSVIEPVWQLLSDAYAQYGVLPTLLERDFNFPGMAELLGEISQIRTRQQLATAALTSP